MNDGYRFARPILRSGAGGGTRTPTGLPPTDFRTRYGFRRPIPRNAAPEGFVVWTIPSPCPAPGFRCCPSSLYTFPFPGLARDCHLTGSPEFGQFCIFGFPESTQVWSKSVASTSFATPAQGIAIALPLASANREPRSRGYPYFRGCLGRFAFAAPFGVRPFGRFFGAAGIAALLTLTAAASIMFLMWAA